jgi:mannose-6-phosphate isomerase-like protein (cupin superfamily)
MRRVVTGHRNGKSVILDDAEISGQGMFGFKTAMLWKTQGIPTVPRQEKDFKEQLLIEFPKQAETVMGISVFPPDAILLKMAKEQGVDMQENWRKQYGDDFGMHTTNTVDYNIVLSGEIWMEVDDGVEVHLKTGDCLIQNGTRHAWRNKSSENCVMASVLIGAKRKK